MFIRECVFYINGLNCEYNELSLDSKIHFSSNLRFSQHTILLQK
jgi:hypothetical protein